MVIDIRLDATDRFEDSVGQVLTMGQVLSTAGILPGIKFFDTR